MIKRNLCIQMYMHPHTFTHLEKNNNKQMAWFMYGVLIYFMGSLFPSILANLSGLASVPLEMTTIERSLTEAGCVDYAVAHTSWIFKSDEPKHSLFCYDNCPKYIITRCPRDGNKNVFKVFWDIRFGKAVFLPIELFISDASPQGNSNDYYNLAWNFQADSILTKEKYGLPM
ncbi:hypothetical protein HMI54_006084, partial [Coelomomyces lativittatus]